MEALLRTIYYVPTPPPKKRTRPLKVICVGVARTGTESLKTALLQLGYEEVSHGFVWWLHHCLDSAYMYQLLLKRDRGQTISAEEFDRVFGQYDALVDVPSIWFAADILKAYPDAKVIVNRRNEPQEWKRSFRESVLPMMLAWDYWWTSCFNTELFWGLRLTNRMWMEEHFKNDFERNAINAYERHYNRVEAVLENQKREYLDWIVQDGWSPLCQFLDKPIPKTDFPKSNLAAEFGPKLMTVDAERMRKAKRNASILGALLTLVISAVCWKLLT